MSTLEGMLVVSIEQAVAAPLCTSRLADAGARVIKIERVEGDFGRGYDTAAKGESSYFAWLNQGKESACLDIKNSDDAQVLWSVIKQADVFVQNLSPGALARSGFSSCALHEANPGLIICNISGYGSAGDLATKRAYDLLVQAESGLISVSGDASSSGRIGVSICDIGAGITAYSAILEALIQRSLAGVGAELSISLFDVAAEWMTVPYIHAQYGSGAPVPVGLHHPSIAPYGAFQCSDDKWVLISIQNEREWIRLCADVLQSSALVENALYTSNNKRVDNRAALEDDINRITGSMTSVEFEQRLSAASIAYGVIHSASDLAHHDALRTRTVTTADGNTLTLPAQPVIQNNFEAKTVATNTIDSINIESNHLGSSHLGSNDIKSKKISRTPVLGEHTDAIRAEFAVNQKSF